MTQDDQLVIGFTMATTISADLTVQLTASPGTRVTAHDQPALVITATVHAAVPVSLQLTAPTGSGSASNVQDHLHVMDDQLHIGIPSSLLVTVGPQWHWSATATSGEARGRCPLNAGSAASDSAVIVG
ncbi:hypothetical protein SAMN04488543_0096 [Friedmanniella luteola]|uniref:Uncharacterized protein n=1 Tax=Friedmanniella luteola TaxID=546871 RepID=A0A1H1L5X7_9ACTN|nr:hypothetical protein [Friedmanniella luteola]SDR69807.1 hypothetical protein SAMN04488543_0096 [Friedmanniella luteola]